MTLYKKLKEIITEEINNPFFISFKANKAFQDDSLSLINIFTPQLERTYL